MTKLSLLRFTLGFAAFISLALTPIPVLAQHGGHGGGGGFHGGGGGGGFHGTGGVGGFSRAGGGESHGGSSYGGGARSSGGEGGYRGGSEAGRSAENHSSSFRPAINDGQWHSFGNSSSSARLSEGRNSGRSPGSNLMARNVGSSDGAWHSFGSVGGSGLRGGFVGGPSRVAPGFGWHGGYGYGWGRGWGCCGWGFGWPYWGFYWGPSWALWNPWWYSPYWYGPWPGYAYYPDYSYDWLDNPPPYRPTDPSADNDAKGSYLSAPSLTYDNQFDPEEDTSPGDNGSVQNEQTPLNAAPSNSDPASQTRVISKPQT
jgi:hypothetical protein